MFVALSNLFFDVAQGERRRVFLFVVLCAQHIITVRDPVTVR